MKERQYFHPERKRYLSTEELRRTRRKTKTEVMRAWFLSNYEDPAENTPYESAEGGYIYIWGGPYEAKEELFSEFHDLVSEAVIDELADELTEISWEWTGIQKDEDLDDYLTKAITEKNNYHENFKKSISNIKNILEVNIEANLQEHLYRLLYANAITVMETYLSDAFINTIIPDKKHIRKLIETTKEFQEQKVSVSEIFKESENIESRVKTYLTGLLWHKLSKVKHLYKNTLGVNFPDELKDLFRAVKQRHDLVHRNGKTTDETEICISREDVVSLLNLVETLVDDIEEQITNLKEPPF